VSSPDADSLALAVSALGRKGTYPPSVTKAAEAVRPWGRDRNDFIAAFSNMGPETDLTGPGVGVISTSPGGYAVLDGTSMACPAATGAAARQLATSPDLLTLPRDQARSDAIVAAILQAARPLGFSGVLEGRGLL
jgi:subtilisin